MNYRRRYYVCPELEEIHNIRDVLRKAKRDWNNMIAFQQYETRILESRLSYRGLSDNVDSLGTALIANGYKGKHFGIIGETSIEWIIAYFAVICGAGIAVPLDRELIDETLAHQLRFGDVDAVFCSEKSLKKLMRVLPECPNVKTVIVMRGNVPEGEKAQIWYDFSSLIEDGKHLLVDGNKEYVEAEIDPKALVEIVFTSGTTGANKGVMISHENLWTCGKGARQLVHFRSTNLSVLPVNHTYELTCNIISSLYEGSLVSINDDLKHVLQNLQHFQPRMSCMVPTMLDLMVRKIKVETEKAGLTGHMEYARTFSNILRKFGIDHRRVFFKPILDRFGGKLEKIICGGAPLSPETVEFLDSIGITVLNGYGITECAPLVAVNGDKLIRKGAVGHVLPSCKVRIENPDENGNGEILVKGGNVMLGYYKMPEDTKAVFTDDGWFRTGDIGHLDSDNFLFISGRIKNIIILSNGKNIYPEEIEERLLNAIPYLKEVVVMADKDNTGIYAICYPDQDFCKENNLTVEMQYKRLMTDVDVYNKKAESFKRISNVIVSESEFEKTTTNKIKRYRIEREFQHV